MKGFHIKVEKMLKYAAAILSILVFPMFSMASGSYYTFGRKGWFWYERNISSTAKPNEKQRKVTKKSTSIHSSIDWSAVWKMPAEEFLPPTLFVALPIGKDRQFWAARCLRLLT